MEKKAAALSGTPADRSEFTRTISISVDSYRQTNQFIDNLIERSKRTKRPGGLWILGDGGVGKSFILDAVYDRYEPTETQTHRYCPVLSLSFASRPAESDILLSLLIQLGQDPTTIRYQNNADLQAIVLDGLVQCGSLAFLFDEAHHLFINVHAKRNMDRLGGRNGDFIKRLYDESGMACIFAGTMGLAEFIASDTQAKTRWSGTIRLQHFANDAKFRGLLQAIDSALPMPALSGLATEEFAGKLYVASQGNFRLLKSLLAEAVFIASSEGSQNLTLAHLARAHFLCFCTEETPFGVSR